MGKPHKAEIWHAGAVGHGNGSGQVGGELSHVERGQGHVQAPQSRPRGKRCHVRVHGLPVVQQVHLLGHGEGLEG